MPEFCFHNFPVNLFQYKDAFMRANPDYKWHNPDKLGTPVTMTKPSTRPSNVRPGGREDDCHTEGSIVSGKLAGDLHKFS